MKKLLALLLALTLMLSLAACGGDDKDTASGDNTSTTQTDGSESTGTTDESTGSSDATDSTATSTPTTDSTEGTSTSEETSKPTETTKPSETSKPEHKHSYTSKVTKEATCGADGTKTFNCSCGDTYTEKIAATGHKWSTWNRKTYAFIDKAGSDERVCSTCSSTETRERTENAVANSFQDGGLQYITWSGGTFNAYFMYPYACHEFHSYIEKPNIPAADVFALLSKCFNVTDEIKNDIKNNNKASGQGEYGYDATTDTFFLPYHAEQGNFLFVGYKHNGGNKYTTYYSYSEFSSGDNEEVYWSFEVEYNRSNGQPNKYLSASKVASVPNDIIKTDGWVEFEGPIAK